MQARQLSIVTLSILVLAAMMAVPCEAQVYAQGDCTGISATVDIDAHSHTCPDTLEADGDWSVSTGADRVYLVYSVDSGSPIQTETRSGLSGSWDFADNYSDGCDHTFEVEAYPQVWNGMGYATCWTHGDSDSAAFHVSCTSPTATISDCDYTSCPNPFMGSCTGSCEGSVTGGAGSPFTYTWTWLDGGVTQKQTGSQSTVSFTCDAGTSISLEGRDEECGTDTSTWTCGID